MDVVDAELEIGNELVLGTEDDLLGVLAAETRRDVLGRTTALALQAAGTAMLVILLVRTDDKKQVLSAVAVASLLSTLLAYSIVPARPSVCFWAGPIIVGIVGYVAAYFIWGSVDPVTWKSGQGGGLFIPLARPLPLDYASLGTAGAILGYCTDTTYDPRAGLDHELKLLNIMFSMQDLIKMMGPNTASYIQMSDQLGTLEAGKLADLILLDGDPREGYWNWLKTKVVVKGGAVVVDKR